VTTSPPPHGLTERAYLAARRRSIDPRLSPVVRRQALDDLQQLRRGPLGAYRAAELDDQLLLGHLNALTDSPGTGHGTTRALPAPRRHTDRIPA